MSAGCWSSTTRRTAASHPSPCWTWKRTSLCLAACCLMACSSTRVRVTSLSLSLSRSHGGYFHWPCGVAFACMIGGRLTSSEDRGHSSPSSLPWSQSSVMMMASSAVWCSCSSWQGGGCHAQAAACAGWPPASHTEACVHACRWRPLPGGAVPPLRRQRHVRRGVRTQRVRRPAGGAACRCRRRC